jgi:hypothetical protein
MRVIVNKQALEDLVQDVVNEDRSYRSKNQNELEKALTPIFPQPQMAQQLSQTEVPIEDSEFVPSNKPELGKAAMQMTKKVKDNKVASFYAAFQKLIKKFEEDKTFKPRPLGEAVLRRKKGSADVEFIPTTPAEDLADAGAEIDPGIRRAAPTADTPRPKSKAKPGQILTPDAGESRDVTSDYLRSLFNQNAPTPEWLKNVSIPMSSLVVGDANKLLASIVKKIGEDDITPEALEAELQNVIDNMNMSIKGDAIVISVPGYGYNYTYPLYGDKRNLFSLDQYKELLNALASQTSEGTVGGEESASVVFEDSWGPKYARAISMLRGARKKEALLASLKDFVIGTQTKLTDAVLDSYPESQKLVDTKAVAEKLFNINDDIVDKLSQITPEGPRYGKNRVKVDVEGKDIVLELYLPNELDQETFQSAVFAEALKDLLDVTPEEIKNYVAKKSRKRRSAIKMSRSDENYFYSLGMQLGGSQFKMSADDFAEKMIEVIEMNRDADNIFGDSELVMMVLRSADILDPGQLNLVRVLKDKIYEIFQLALEEKFEPEQVSKIAPYEGIGNMSPAARSIFDDFCADVVKKGFSQKSNTSRFFKIYDLAYAKDIADRIAAAGKVKYTHMYVDPGSTGARAKDVTNLVGNLRYIATAFKEKASDLERARDFESAEEMRENAEELLNPEALERAFNIYVKTNPPIMKKLAVDVANKVSKLTQAELDEPPISFTYDLPEEPEEMPPAAETSGAAPAEPEDLPRPADDVVEKSIGDAVSAYQRAPTSIRDELLSKFERASDPLETSFRLSLTKDFPGITTPADYERLVKLVLDLNNPSPEEIISELVRRYARR